MICQNIFLSLTPPAYSVILMFYLYDQNSALELWFESYIYIYHIFKARIHKSDFWF